MRVKGVAVKGLFGIFDHDIPLQSAERVTIIHGPNGFGKTVVLRMIAALIEGKMDVFEHIPFREFAITLDDDSSRIIRRVADQDTKSKAPVRLELLRRHIGGTEQVVPPPPQPEIPQQLLRAVDINVPAPYRLAGAVWTDGNRVFSLQEILQMFPEAEQALPRKFRPGLPFDICRELQVFFVETNRLVSEVPTRRPNRYAQYLDQERQEPTPRVKHYSDDIVQRIRQVLADYARRSQDRDRTFPERLVRFLREPHTRLPEHEVLAKMADFEQKRRRLNTLGLLDREPGLHDLTADDVRRVQEALTIYVSDVEEKLSIFDDIARRIGALIDILNSRFKYKHLTVNRELGFRVFSNQGQPIDLQDLSSGEQHEVVLLYELLFRGPDAGLVLVDEPEISLHVAWQSRFLSDLITILQPTDSYAIVATHSPVIIGTRSDLTVELKGPESATKDDVDA